MWPRSLTPGAWLHWRRVAAGNECGGMNSSFPSGTCHRRLGVQRFQYPPEIVVALRWYLPYEQWRDAAQLSAKGGVDHPRRGPLVSVRSGPVAMGGP